MNVKNFKNHKEESTHAVNACCSVLSLLAFLSSTFKIFSLPPWIVSECFSVQGNQNRRFVLVAQDIQGAGLEDEVAS